MIIKNNSQFPVGYKLVSKHFDFWLCYNVTLSVNTVFWPVLENSFYAQTHVVFHSAAAFLTNFVLNGIAKAL